MASSSSLSFIVCSSCGSFIGHKHLSYINYINHGATEVEAFECLNVPLYCCRMLLSNPIVTTTNYGKENSSKKKVERVIEEKEEELITFKLEGNYFSNLTEEAEVKEPIRKVINLKDSLNATLKEKREYKAPTKKIVDLSSLRENSSLVNIGDKFMLKKIHKICSSFEYEN